MKNALFSAVFFFSLIGALQPGFAQITANTKIIWDDFNYSGWSDTAFLHFGWRARTGTAGTPGNGNGWSENNITFIKDALDTTNMLMRFSSYTNGQTGATSTVQTQADRQPRECVFGTYGARIKFNNTAFSGTNVQADQIITTFYIFGSLEGDGVQIPGWSYPYCTNCPNYSEIDFEYGPHGAWGGSTQALYNFTHSGTSYTSQDPQIGTTSPGDFSGWKTYWVTVTAQGATYHVDNQQTANHSTAKLNTKMSLNFNLWFYAIGSGGSKRTYVQDIDWVFYAESTNLTLPQINTQVADLRAKSRKRFEGKIGLLTNINDHYPQRAIAKDFPVIFRSDHEIEFPVSGASMQKVTLFDPSGKIASTLPVVQGRAVLPSQPFRRGIYLALWENGGGQKVKKVVLP